MNAFRELNWPAIALWMALSAIGLVAIYSATLGPVSQFLPDYIQNNFYRQLVWVAISIVILITLQFTHPRALLEGSYLFYGVCLILMVITLFFGHEVNGAKSWLRIGFLNIQVSELMKISTILATAHYLTSRRNISAENLKNALVAVSLIAIPTILVVLQNDLGTAMIFVVLIPIMLFWSGLPYSISLLMISPAIIGYLSIIGWYWGLAAAILITISIFLLQQRTWLVFASFVFGILVVIGVQVALFQVLQPHQLARIEAFTNPSVDPQGAGWNVLQAKTAIGSGGLHGKGFLEGTQTQLRFLPEQWTDFIFCVVGEEFGFIGTSIITILFMGLILRLLNMAGKSKHPFAQLVMVGVATIFFTHFFINVGSAVGILPVIGLPLPFVSYGGSAFLVNSLMLAICLNLDFYKRQLSIYR